MNSLFHLSKKVLLLLFVVNTALFTIARLTGVSIWKVLVAEIICYLAWQSWKGWSHPAQQLVVQASHMDWRLEGTVKDEDGFRDTLVRRNGIVARISFQERCVYIIAPKPSGPFKDFVEIERYLCTDAR